LYQRVQRRAGGADKGTDRSLVPTEPPGERGSDLRIAEVEFRRADRGLILRERRLGLVRGAGALVESILGEVAAFGQRGPAFEITARKIESRRVAPRLRLRLIQYRLEVARCMRTSDSARSSNECQERRTAPKDTCIADIDRWKLVKGIVDLAFREDTSDFAGEPWWTSKSTESSRNQAASTFLRFEFMYTRSGRPLPRRCAVSCYRFDQVGTPSNVTDMIVKIVKMDLDEANSRRLPLGWPRPLRR
jgi:hypothetical protein